MNPQIKIGDIVHCRYTYDDGWWIGTVVKINFQVGEYYIIEVDEAKGIGRAAFSVGMLEYRPDGEWWEWEEEGE